MSGSRRSGTGGEIVEIRSFRFGLAVPPTVLTVPIVVVEKLEVTVLLRERAEDRGAVVGGAFRVVEGSGSGVASISIAFIDSDLLLIFCFVSTEAMVDVEGDRAAEVDDRVIPTSLDDLAGFFFPSDFLDLTEAEPAPTSLIALDRASGSLTTRISRFCGSSSLESSAPLRPPPPAPLAAVKTFRSVRVSH